MSHTAKTRIKFVIGSRILFSASRRLTPVAYSLSDLVSHSAKAISHIGDFEDGYRILSAPIQIWDEFSGGQSGFVSGGLQCYQRYYIDMRGSYEDYLARFSSKTRSTFGRKQRKLAEFSGGTLDIREYRTPAEIISFHADATRLSRKTYQAKLLDAGLPEGDTARDEMCALAAQDQVRAYLLYLDDKPVSYLYLPIHDGVIAYAHLGYDPAVASMSVGTVLQLHALERLFGEDRYRYFDFTEGEGAHKKMFGTDSIEACSFLVLKRTFANIALIKALDAFDAAIARVRDFVEARGSKASLRNMLRH
jgi:CelD/BcsL family acetyltransferase involved in cellulose biosynthesis